MPTIREIRGFEYECGKCGATHIQDNANGHYSNSTPPGWITVTAHMPLPKLKSETTIPPMLLEQQGATTYIQYLLCEVCSERLRHMLVTVLKKNEES